MPVLRIESDSTHSGLHTSMSLSRPWLKKTLRLEIGTTTKTGHVVMVRLEAKNHDRFEYNGRDSCVCRRSIVKLGVALFPL
jgi:hypothetical protein